MRETGRSTPELNLIVEIADLLEISVDALIGYKYRNNDREQVLSRIRNCRHSRDTEGLIEAEKALKRYPNNFDIAYNSALLYRVIGLVKGDKALLKRALTLMEHARLLADQCTDKTISDSSLAIEMAGIYTDMDDNTAALELLIDNNPSGINNEKIGMLLSQDKTRLKESAHYLSEALLDLIVKQINVVEGFINLYEKRGGMETEMIEIIDWQTATFERLKKQDEVSFIDKAEAVIFVLKAAIQYFLGNNDEARTTLKTARVLAERFDESPCYDAGRIKFVELTTERSTFDNMGETAMSAVGSMVELQKSDGLKALWEEVCSED